LAIRIRAGSRALKIGHDFIGLGTPEIGVHEVVTTTFWRLQYRRGPLMGTVRHPVLVLVGDFVENRVSPAFPRGRVEEADDAFGLLKRLDQSVQKQPVETPIGEANVILVVLEKGVMETSSVVSNLRIHP